MEQGYFKEKVTLFYYWRVASMCIGKKEEESWPFFKIKFNFPSTYELSSVSKVPSQTLQKKVRMSDTFSSWSHKSPNSGNIIQDTVDKY